LVDILSTIDDAPPPPRNPPSSVTQARICWPLGLRREATPPGLCHQERSAWMLNNTAPSTFPDRLRDGAARYIDYRDAASGERLRAGCAAPASWETRVAVDMARWPAALEPWLNSDIRRQALPPAWSPECVRAQAPEAGLKIAGISDGETVRRAGGAAGPLPTLRLEARGGQAELIWLINGQHVGRSPANRALLHTFNAAGRYRITVMDDAGRYDRVEISVR
jgi:penicillin-binding protein 1C